MCITVFMYHWVYCIVYVCVVVRGRLMIDVYHSVFVPLGVLYGVCLCGC